MICPHCHAEIPDRQIATYLGQKGGRRGKRTLSTSLAKAMAQKSARVRQSRAKAKTKTREEP